jgi:hypothetical protein
MNDSGWAVAGVILFVVLSAGCLWGWPQYKVYSQDLSGQAQLAEAEWTKKILIEEATAQKVSATLYADAEVERAKGVAKANEIIGDSLKGNEAYLRYLWIQGLHDGTSELVYVPTEAGLPILEATRSAGK